jgi:hypothetical protein
MIKGDSDARMIVEVLALLVCTANAKISIYQGDLGSFPEKLKKG